jgi:hypothetical protein
MPQVEQFSDPAYEGVGAAIVVMRGNAITMACASLCAISRLDMREVVRARGIRSVSSRFPRS